MQELKLNVESFFLFRILVETEEKLFPLFLRVLLYVILLLSILIIVPLALWYYILSRQCSFVANFFWMKEPSP